MQPLKVVAALLGVAVLAAIGGVIWFAVASTHALPDGPVQPVWDKTACEFCKMHVGEPAFAAQLQTRAGEVWFYDDPGCLFEHLERDRADVHAIWFHSMRQEGWIARDDVAFVPASPTPMGFGIGAVRADSAGPEALSFAQTAQKLRTQEHR